MQDRERQLYETRTGQFVDRLKAAVYGEEAPLQAEVALCDPPLSFERRLQVSYRPIAAGEVWGEPWQVAWFRVRGVVPQAWQGRHVVARLNFGGEGLIFSPEGVPLHATSWHSLWQPEFRRDRIGIANPACGGETVDFYAEATASQIFGLQRLRDPEPDDPKGHGYFAAVVQELVLAVFHDEIWQLYLDAALLHAQMKVLPEKSVRRSRLLRALMLAADHFDREPARVAEAREVLQAELLKKSNASAPVASAVGHAHIDTGWLWPVSESVRKCARTFAAQLDLIARYPDYIFGASQAQHYAFVKQHYPALYEKIRCQVAAGRWEIQGGMWVEADCNLSGGESLVRQILHGKRFFKEEFGVEVRNLWLPDVFGYSAALPQILRKSGIDYMVTQKISWNQFNRFPHHSFIWRGIDGSEIIAHFPPEDSYNSELNPAGLHHAQENFEERDRLDEFLVLFGIGDGGGGPTAEFIESGLRQQDLEESPRVRFQPAQEMLDRLGEKAHLLKRWNGELYLELHRGTLTTQASVKKMNRWCEKKLREVEALYCLLPWPHYPQAQLDALWKKVLLNQFHDILPGSSIKLVYDTARQEYDEIKTALVALTAAAGETLLPQRQDAVTLINTLSVPFCRPVTLPDSWAGHAVLDEEGKQVAVQVSEGQTAALVQIPPLGAVVLQRGTPTMAPRATFPPTPVLENELIRYEFNAAGVITRIYDKEAGREVMLPGQLGNLFSLYEDRPANWDAWDVDIYYENQLLQTAQCTGWSWRGDGAVARILQIDFSIGHSRIGQRVYLPCNSKRLDFVTRIDWRERHRMLRVSFDVDVNALEAGYEIQYGTVKRPTHRNTSWDMARFETVGHRFVDLSEPSYGVALLNNGKYGHKILECSIDLNLLRAPSSPDPEADRGEHETTFSLLPHRGALEDSEVYAEALQLNQPPAVFVERAGEVRFPCALSGDEVILEVLKKAEDEPAWIVRLYEPRGRRVTARLLLRDEAMRVIATDLLERELGEVKIDNGAVALSLAAFDIKTLKITV